ncbi:MAG: hypothetical protein ACYCOO_09605 [Chitinophagaceae bacterium]
MLKYNSQTLSRIEKIFEEGKYILRYEKGSFTSGHCLLEERKVVVVNKFLNLEGRINTLVDILPSLVLSDMDLSEASMKLFQQILKENPIPAAFPDHPNLGDAKES